MHSLDSIFIYPQTTGRMSLLVHGSVFSPPTFPTDSIILPSLPNSHICRTLQGYTVWTVYFLSRMTLRMIRHTVIGGQKVKQRWNSSVERRTGTGPHRWNWSGSKVPVRKVAISPERSRYSSLFLYGAQGYIHTVPSNLEMLISCRIRRRVFSSDASTDLSC